MDESLELVPCLFCNSTDTEVLLRGRRQGRIVRCKNDGLVFLVPRPSVEFLRNFHSGFVRHGNLELFSGFRRNILKREADVIKRIKSGGKLLDIGCATGTLFENFQTGAWRLFGVDTSGLGADEARRRYSADVFCGTLQEARWPDGFFDVVTMLDTIYYLPDPKSELREINRILKPDGLLVVEIPGLNYTLLREKAPLRWLLDWKRSRRLADSFHLFHFSPRTLPCLLEGEGFLMSGMVPEQASLSGGTLKRIGNEVHFALARSLFSLSRGTVSCAAKELYLAAKVSSVCQSVTGSAVRFENAQSC